MSTTHDITTGGIAALASTDDRTTAVHGVVLGPGDVTDGLSGKRTRWPADVLEAMADEGLFEGKPITLADSMDPEQHVGVEATDDGAQVTGAVSMDEKMGEVTRTAFDPDAGLVFEGFVMDWVAGDLVETGLAQVSPVIAREVEQVEDGDPPLFEATDVEAARDLALVADGAVPSNDIAVGPLDAQAAEALSAQFGVDVDAGAAAPSGGQPGGDDGPDGGSAQSTPDSGWREHMTDENSLTDKERELLARAGQLDDPVVVESGVRERLSDLEEQFDEYEDLIDAADAVDDAEVMDAEEAAAMQARVAIVEEMMAEALTEQKGLREATVEAMSFEAMASEFRTDEGDLDVEALTQTPEGGSGPTGDGGGDGVTDEDRERIQQIDEKLDVMGSVLPQSRVEALREEATDLADADDFDAALEVL